MVRFKICHYHTHGCHSLKRENRKRKLFMSENEYPQILALFNVVLHIITIFHKNRKINGKSILTREHISQRQLKHIQQCQLNKKIMKALINKRKHWPNAYKKINHYMLIWRLSWLPRKQLLSIQSHNSCRGKPLNRFQMYLRTT